MLRCVAFSWSNLTFCHLCLQSQPAGGGSRSSGRRGEEEMLRGESSSATPGLSPRHDPRTRCHRAHLQRAGRRGETRQGAQKSRDICRMAVISVGSSPARRVTSLGEVCLSVLLSTWRWEGLPGGAVHPCCPTHIQTSRWWLEELLRWRVFSVSRHISINLGL